MKFTKEMFISFLNQLILFIEESQRRYDAADFSIKNYEDAEKNILNEISSTLKDKVDNFSLKIKEDIFDFRKKTDNIFAQNIKTKMSILKKIQICKEKLNLILCIEKTLFNVCSDYIKDCDIPISNDITLDKILNGKIDFVEKACELYIILNSNNKKKITIACESFWNTCESAKKVLENEIESLCSHSVQDNNLLNTECFNQKKNLNNILISSWTAINVDLNKTSQMSKERKISVKQNTKEKFLSNSLKLKQSLKNLEDSFLAEFPPQDLESEYIKLYSKEPLFDEFECCKEIPKCVHIGTLEYDLTSFDLNEYLKEFLNKYYYFMYRGNLLCIPYCVYFDSESNLLFEFSEEQKKSVVKSACNIGIRLFMMSPPGKIEFTFVDPIALGESFAMFNRLVDIDNRTSEVINGKIWSSPADIEQKLKIMTDHISNVTQRCLQGKYDNIYEYNRVAEQNAEAYQVLMLMDFPAGLTEQSLKLLEQIVTSGPKCGVFTVIYRNESQYKKISERSYPLITNIETSFQVFNFNENCTQISCSGEKIKDKPLVWNNLQQPSTEQMDQIIAALKKGIKNADKVVIGIDKVSDAESTSTTKDGIRIPIGIHGANEVQYLTLGVGGSHHALIAGVAGSGKSSLLHTIILRTLTQYTPDELSIYLVDFKRGVEFKIYADFVLPAFKVIAIESEREFGYNILLALEREQKIRADLFKKSHVDKIEEYRELGKKMPRILVIMDEFHELFSNANDEFAKKSATIMERIVRQGRAFGVHLILASQSYSNITGIDRAVFDQMAVRIVLKCSKADANLLLDNGSTEIDQISIDDPGRAVYNSEAGNKEYNSHFRVAYIAPEKHRDMLQEISDRTISYADKPTRILLSNIEDNKYSIFNQFVTYEPSRCPVPGRLYIGEPLSVTNNMNMDLVRSDNANLLMLGNDTEKARSMFAFAILSLCINYWVKNRKAPENPFIYLLNCKPLDDSYFKDTPQIIASELLPEYVRYVHCGDESATQEVLSELHDNIKDSNKPIDTTDKFFFVFGYQRAEELKSEIKLSQSDDIDSLFNIMSSNSNRPQLSPKEIFHTIVKDGAKHGVHVILWQDSFSALEQDDNNIMSYFSLKVAFDMSPEEFSRSVGANDVSLMSENNAIYYNKARDNQKFRPYQAPDEEWLKGISAKLH